MILAWIITCIVIGAIVGSLTRIGIIGLIVGGWFFFVGLPTMLKYSFAHRSVNRIVDSVDRSRNNSGSWGRNYTAKSTDKLKNPYAGNSQRTYVTKYNEYGEPYVGESSYKYGTGKFVSKSYSWSKEYKDLVKKHLKT